MTTKQDLEDLALMALSAGAGAVDETAFGLPKKYIPGFQQLQEKNPNSYLAGQVGSFFIPGTGVIGLGSRLMKLEHLAKLAKMAEEGKLIVRSSKAAQGPIGSILAKVGMKAAESGASGAVEAGGQTAIRNLLGTAGSGDVGENAKTGAQIGATVGAASPLLGSLARKLYSHPKIYDPKNPKANELLDKLLKEGVWGGENTFRRKAESAKGKYNEIMDPLRNELANRRVSMDELVGAGSKDSDAFATRHWNKKRTGQKSAAAQFQETLSGAKADLGDNPKMKDVNDYLSVINKELSGLKPQKRAEAITGVGGQATNTDEALGAMKASIERLERKKIAKKFGQEGEQKIKQAKESWGEGRNLERALDRPETLSQVMKNVLPVPAVAGTLGGVAAGTVGLPTLITAGAVGAGTAAAKSLPGRTGMGVLLDRISKSPSMAAAKAGRGVEFANRDEPAYRLNESGAEETPTGTAWRKGENPFLDGIDLGEEPKPKKEKAKSKAKQDTGENIFLEGLDL